VNPRSPGKRAPCTVPDAKARLLDAEAFLEAARGAKNHDVIATNAIHSAIAAADAICCVALRERSADGNHAAAVSLLARVDPKLATALKRALDRQKTQAAYESRDVAASDPTACVCQATTLINAARDRLVAT
jgi:hypothetical protein